MEEKKLVEVIAKSLVDNPEKVKINMVESEKTIIIELSVNEQDIGKIIGKHGRIAMAIRIILSGISNKINKRIILDIID